MLRQNAANKIQQIETIKVLQEKKEVIDKRLNELSKIQFEIIKENKELKDKIYAQKDIIQRINYIGSQSVTEMMNRLEIVAEKNNLDILDLSLKDNEIYLYLRKDKDMDNIKLIKEFETEFPSVMLKEYNTQKLLIKLGDKSE